MRLVEATYEENLRPKTKKEDKKRELSNGVIGGVVVVGRFVDGVRLVIKKIGSSCDRYLRVRWATHPYLKHFSILYGVVLHNNIVGTWKPVVFSS